MNLYSSPCIKLLLPISKGLLILLIFCLSGMGCGNRYKDITEKALKGDAEAQFGLGLMLAEGVDGFPHDDQKAVEWFRLSATQGYPDAQYALGRMYFKGEGVLQNYEETLKWYRLAANQGHEVSQWTLGWMYFKGEGVPKDYKEALNWYSLAAYQGDVDAQLKLGIIHASDGHGIAKDIVQAYAWFNIAATRGNKTAMEHRTLILQEMTPSQIQEGQALSRELLKK